MQANRYSGKMTDRKTGKRSGKDTDSRDTQIQGQTENLQPSMKNERQTFTVKKTDVYVV